MNLFTRISLRSQSDATGYGFTEYRVLGTFREPRVFSTAADAFLTAVVEQQNRSSFNFARRGFSAEMVRRFTPAFSLIGSYQTQRTELFDEQIDRADQPLIDRLFPQVLLSSFAVAGIHDTRNDQLNPSAGHYLSANGQVAAKAIGSEVGLLEVVFHRTGIPGPAADEPDGVRRERAAGHGDRVRTRDRPACNCRRASASLPAATPPFAALPSTGSARPRSSMPTDFRSAGTASSF